MLKKKRLLLLGCTGFIGSSIYRGFQRHFLDVLCPYRRSSKNASNISEISGHSHFHVYEDNNQLAFLINDFSPDVVINAVGAYDRTCSRDQVISANISFVKELYQTLSAAGKKIIFVHLSTTVNDICSEYSRSKAEAKTYLDRMNYEFGNIKQFIVSPHIVYGPGDNPETFLGSLNRAISERETEFLVLNPEEVRKFVFVEDLVDAIFFLIKFAGKLPARHFEVGDNSNEYKLKYVAQQMVELRKSPIRLKYAPVGNISSSVDLPADRNDAVPIGLYGWQPHTPLTRGLQAIIENPVRNWDLRENEKR